MVEVVVNVMVLSNAYCKTKTLSIKMITIILKRKEKQQPQRQQQQQAKKKMLKNSIIQIEKRKKKKKQNRYEKKFSLVIFALYDATH